MEASDTGQHPSDNMVMERNTAPNKKQKLAPLDQLTREEVEARVRKLESHNLQLQNLLVKSQGGGFDGQKCGKAKKTRPFDFTKHCRRHVLLKFAYLGWDYQGYAAQEDTQATIEAQLFPALLKTRLIQSREISNYHRCGRTDKGVSAFEQVVSLTLRSNCQTGVGVLPPPGPPGTEMPPVVKTSEAHKKLKPPETLRTEEASCRVEQDPLRPSVSPASPVTDTIVDDCTEINYVMLLNRVLPPEIRMLAWSPVSPGYSARFDCSARTYKYFFPRANLNLDVMQEAASEVVGHHDFRNFCKMDVANGVVSFIRRIRAINITTLAHDLPSHADQRRAKTLSSNKHQRGRSHGSEDKMMNGCEDQEQPMTSGVIEINMTNAENTTSQTTHHNINSLHSTHQENEDPHSTHKSKDLNFNPPRMDSEGYEMCVATIEGEAFLWHQIRCIMAVLMLVGEGLEDPSVVTCLLDVNKQPRKPQYKMASEIPLNLYGTSFDGVLWRWDDESLYLTLTRLQHLWTQHSVRANMIRRMLWDLEHKYLEITDGHHSTLSNKKQEEEEQTVNNEDKVNTVVKVPSGKSVNKGSVGGSSVITTAIKEKRQNDEEKEKEEWKRETCEKEQEKIDDYEKDMAKRDIHKKIEKVDHLKKGVNIKMEIDHSKEKETSENNKSIFKHKETEKMDYHKKGLTDEMEIENREEKGVSESTGNKRPIKHKDSKMTSCPQESITSPRSLRQQSSCLVSTNSGKVYRPLLSLPTCESLETRVQHYVKRQRLDPDILLKLNTTKKNGGNS